MNKVAGVAKVAAVAAVVLVLIATDSAHAVDRSKFKTCAQSGFCNRHRHASEGPYSLTGTPRLNAEGALEAQVEGGGMPLVLTVDFFESGVARTRLAEAGLEPRWTSPDVVLEANLKRASDAAIVPATDAAVTAASASSAASGTTFVSYTTSDGAKALYALNHSPFSVSLYLDGKLQVSANQRGLSYFEHRRSRSGAPGIAATAGQAVRDGDHASTGRKILDWGEDGKPIYADGDEGDELDLDAEGAVDPAADTGKRELQAAGDNELWEERYGAHTDTKALGPTSVGVDITFHDASDAYGIPEHATALSLKPTDGSSGAYSDPYRLYNLDVFEYELDNPMALYGSIPVMFAHSSSGAGVSGAYWNNPTETYVDLAKDASGVQTRWMSESGTWDLFLLPGPTAKDSFRQYTTITGTQALPPLFALGYHQCRWNYKDEADVFAVDAKFEEHNFPYDVLWLDIEHTDGKRYFTWDRNTFPNPAAMQEKLAARGRKMVTIVDPHIKRDGGFHVHSEATSKGYYIKNKSGSDLDGWCWPGSSSYLDFTSPVVRSWWADQFALDKYQGSTLSLYTWNDMNEPSVFNGPEVTMDKDAKSLAGVEHREWHNLYGFYQQWATGEGQSRRVPDSNSRPFVLSRAFFAGSQRFGAIWTGDNFATWDHLAVSAPMLMSIGVSGLTFSGADVGGFFKNPDAELMTRWYQAGSFQPFFRAHAHIETKRREPWLFGDETMQRLRSSVRTRYAYLPYWYTLFYQAHTEGMPTMRPLWVHYGDEAITRNMDDQWLGGSDLLVKPITRQGQVSTSVYFPGSEPWYDVVSRDVYVGPGQLTVNAPLDKIPVFQRGGSIVPQQSRPRRCSALMAADPYTLVVALDRSGKATGFLYLDDGISFNFERSSQYRLRRFSFENNVLTSTTESGKAYTTKNTIERIVIVGVSSAPAAVTVKDHNGAVRLLTTVYDASTKTLTVRKPDVAVAYDFTLQLE